MTAKILVKLQPNQDVTLALEAAARQAGFAAARIHAAVGSLVEGVLVEGDSVAIVPGPGIEVAALQGEIDPYSGGTRLHGHLCLEDTSVASGTLVRGRNAVGVTFEVLLEEVAAMTNGGEAE
jgi:predicted DNA-binding protein with PD1-like motif